jgi:hypothetical protein
MANKRMFSKEITNSDVFLDLSLSSQALYFHLGMNADDDGFVQPKSIIRLIQAKEADLIILAEKGFIIPFQNSVVVLTHWKINNDLKIDRVKPTIYQQHLHELSLCNKIYIQNSMLQNVSKMDTECIQNVSKMDTQYSIVEYSIVEGSQEGKCQADDIPEKEQEQKSANAKALTFDFSSFTDNEQIAINNWFDYKKQIKKQYKTQSGMNTLCNNLKKYKVDGHDIVAIIDNSIMNEYIGIFAPKFTNNANNTNREPDKSTNLKAWLKWKYKDTDENKKWWWWENLKGDPVSIQVRFFETKYEEACDYLGIDYMNRVNEAHANGYKYLIN